MDIEIDLDYDGRLTATGKDVVVSAINISNKTENLGDVIPVNPALGPFSYPFTIEDGADYTPIAFSVDVEAFSGDGDPWGFDVEIVYNDGSSPKRFRVEGTLVSPV